MCINKRGYKDYARYFIEGDKFFDELKSFDENTKLLSLNLSKIKKSDLLTWEETVKQLPPEKNMFPAIEKEMFLKVRDPDIKRVVGYPILGDPRQTANTLMRLQGEGTEFLANNQSLFKIVAMNAINNMTDKQVKAFAVVKDNAIRALLSADYRYNSAYELYIAFWNYFKEKFHEIEFMHGFNSYDYVKSIIKICGKKQLAQQYDKEANYEIGIKFATSETGKSSTTVELVIVTEDGNIVIPSNEKLETEKIRMVHKGNHNMETFMEKLELVVTESTNFVEHISKQQKIVLSEEEAFNLIPLICANEKFKNIGKRDAAIVQELFKDVLSEKQKDYETYISLLDEDEEIPNFEINMYDVIKAFILLQKYPTLTKERVEKLEYLAATLIISDLRKLSAKHLVQEAKKENNS